MADGSRIEDLRRRIEKDPASIAFAQLAEEYRRAGDNEEAIRVCQAGLARYPAYLSARVTLGRALFDLGRLEEARAEFTRVLDAAPDNLAAIGKLAEIHQRSRQDEHLKAREQVPPAPGVDDVVLRELEAWLQAIGRNPSR